MEGALSVQAALANSDVPIARAIALTKDSTVTDAPLMLMEYVDGVVVDDLQLAESISEGFRRGLAHGMVGALVAIHAVDLDAAGLADLSSPRPYAARQLRRWRAQWEASRTREVPEIGRLAERLATALPKQEERTLVHGDFHLRNVIADRASGRPRAILDWELATLGEPLADLGGLLAYWPEAVDPPGEPFVATALPGFPDRAELRELYRKASGRDLSELAFWEVLALWKVAVILEGVRRRGLGDARNAARGAIVDEATIDAVVARAWRTAEAVGL